MSRNSKRRVATAFAALGIAGASGSPAQGQEELYRIQGADDQYLGTELDVAGDLDHDGVQELIATGKGDAHVYSGRSGTLLFEIDLTSYIDSVSPIDDLDGDGTSDLLVMVAEWSKADELHAVSGTDGHDLFTISFSDDYHTVLGIDDVDGDGLADVAHGSWWTNDVSYRTYGEVLVYSSATQMVLLHLFGFDPLGSFFFGGELALGPDVDGDGLREILVATPTSKTAKVVSPGANAVLFELTPPNAGQLSPTCCEDAGDFDGDGIGDLFVGDASANDDGGRSFGVLSVFSGATQQLLHSFHGPAGSWGIGQSVAKVEQLDGDGVDDFVAGAFFFFHPTSQVLLFGGASRSQLYSHSSVQDLSAFGIHVRALGDVDGDGFGDYAFSAAGEGPRHNSVIRVCRGNDLFLDGEPSVVPVGATGSLTLREGTPSGLNAVVAVEVNGTPMFSALFGLTVFDATGTWQYVDTVPPGMGGTTLVFVGYADDLQGGLLASGRETIVIP